MSAGERGVDSRHLEERRDEEPLPEGRRFTVVIEDDDEDFRLDETSLKLLLESQASIRRGKFISAEQMLKELDDA